LTEGTGAGQGVTGNREATVGVSRLGRAVDGGYGCQMGRYHQQGGYWGAPSTEGRGRRRRWWVWAPERLLCPPPGLRAMSTEGTVDKLGATVDGEAAMGGDRYESAIDGGHKILTGRYRQQGGCCGGDGMGAPLTEGMGSGRGATVGGEAVVGVPNVEGAVDGGYGDEWGANILAVGRLQWWPREGSAANGGAWKAPSMEAQLRSSFCSLTVRATDGRALPWPRQRWRSDCLDCWRRKR
jgi:hypothetical protein